MKTSGPYTCGDSTSLLLMGSLTGASTAEHRPPPQKQGSGHCVGAALPLVPSQKTSRVGSTDSTALPSLSAPSLQSVRGQPVPQAALPWGSLLRSTAKTFQNSPERVSPPRLLYLSQSALRQEITLSSVQPASSSYHSSYFCFVCLYCFSRCQSCNVSFFLSFFVSFFRSTKMKERDKYKGKKKHFLTVMPLAAAWWWRSRRTSIPRFPASLMQ